MTDTPKKTKVCSRCRRRRNRINFYVERRNRDGLAAICKACAREKAKQQYAACDKQERVRTHREWVRNNRDRIAVYKIANKIGATVAEVLVVMEQTACAICGTTENLCVDHCHARMALRGRLCGNCNTGLGLFGDDVERLESAIRYLQVFEAKYEPAS